MLFFLANSFDWNGLMCLKSDFSSLFHCSLSSGFDKFGGAKKVLEVMFKTRKKVLFSDELENKFRRDALINFATCTSSLVINY